MTNLIVDASIDTIEVKSNALYLVKINVGKMSPKKSSKYINDVKESGTFDYLERTGGKVVFCACREDTNIKSIDVLSIDTIPVEEMNKLGWYCKDEVTKEVWDSYVSTQLHNDHVQYAVIKQLLDNQWKYYKNFSQVYDDNWKMIIKLVISTIEKSKLFSTVPISVMQGPVDRVGSDEESYKVEAKTMKLKAKWSLEAVQDSYALHGLDIESDLIGALAGEFAAELDTLIGTIKHFCPYTLVMFTPVTLNQKTLAPEMQVMTRFGVVGNDAIPETHDGLK